MASKNRELRSGYTTGACAAAAAKAALLSLLVPGGTSREVEIPFPGGVRHTLAIDRIWRSQEQQGVSAAVIKDAGDDPDITDGAEIVVTVSLKRTEGVKGDKSAGLPRVDIRGGVGVGRVTRPGLPVEVGEAAINPGPRRMISEAAEEALRESQRPLPDGCGEVQVTVSVPRGAELARKTLNMRLGIVGGISILGTTGIVRPVSSEAWTATIATSMNVAEAMGREEIVLSSGRTSERAHMDRYGLPEECYVMMGDYVEFSLLETRKHPFRAIHLSAQWAKLLKTAMATPQTHVRHGAINLKKIADFLRDMGWYNGSERSFHTAREMLEAIRETPEETWRPLLSRVCRAARDFAESITDGVPVSVYLVSYEGEIMAHG